MDQLRVAMTASPRPFLLAADGGAARCLAAGWTPDLVVGDFDSLAEEARLELVGGGVPLRVADRAKDESDLELCLLEALAMDIGPAGLISIFGALGAERPEHTLANLLLLADPRLDGHDVVLVGHGGRIRRIGTADGPGRVDLHGKAGDYVSLFPVGGDVEGVTTEGLRFPLDDERLSVGPSRGLSNELLGDRVRLTTRRGCLLVVHTPIHGQH
jgi:thiamine pyrophosphokinase